MRKDTVFPTFICGDAASVVLMTRASTSPGSRSRPRTISSLIIVDLAAHAFDLLVDGGRYFALPFGFGAVCLLRQHGNLLDNACKWARSAVRVQSLRENGNIVILVDDDGPGIVPEMRNVVLQRGVRADEAAPGSGLGLSIVRDLAEVYGGTISLENSPKGGLRARLQLPAS